MANIKMSKLPAMWIQDKENKLNLFRQYQIFYKDELIAEIFDFNQGFMNLVKRLNPEITVKEID